MNVCVSEMSFCLVVEFLAVDDPVCIHETLHNETFVFPIYASSASAKSSSSVFSSSSLKASASFILMRCGDSRFSDDGLIEG